MENIERRNFLRLSLAATGTALAAGALGIQPANAATPAITGLLPNSLKGMGYGSKYPDALKRLDSLNLDWTYSWGSKYSSTAENFIPMVWGGGAVDTSIKNISSQLKTTRANTILGFNEPDHRSQANMTPDAAIALWPKLEATGMRLGSPATISPNAAWMDEFMTKAKAKRLRIDFVAMHCYQWPNVKDFLRKVDALHDKWGLPVWVTEYAVADWQASATVPNRYSRTQVNEFMEGTVQGMRARPYVERFAWKTREVGDYVMSSSVIFHTDGKLTSTGKLYASL